MQTEGIKQKYLRKVGLLALITVLGMTPPLSTDMYMPSLPKMADFFGAAPVVVNMTMVAFIISMAVGMLVMGPLSDTGSASALLNFIHTLLGSIGMFIGSLPWGSYISGIGITIVGFLLLGLAMWIYVLKSRWQTMNLSA